jgi:amino acid adenylation domain-containing protein
MSTEAQTFEALAADITGQVAGLSPQERELFELLLRQRGIDVRGALILPRPADVAPPLSYAQQRLWFLDQLEPGDPSYNITTTARLNGPLDATRLEDCLNAVVQRHEALRTAFVADGGEARQIIAQEVRIDVARFDLTSAPEGEREEAALRLAAEDARRPFDLTRVPLLRVLLLKLRDTEHLLHLTIHHIVADAWSLGLLIGEVATLYGARAMGHPSELPDVPVQYADFAVWQRERLRGAAFEAQLDYWEKQLAGPVQPLELPTDHPRPAVTTHAGARLPITLSSALSEQVAALARRFEASLFMLLLAAFDALLYRYTGQRDIVVGTPTANRTRFETEKMIGLFINTLPLRVDISGDPTFAELLRRTRAVALDAYANQEVPFEQLIERLKIERQLGRTPLFQVMLTLQNVPAPPAAAQDLSLEVLDVPTGTSKFDLSLTLVETPKGLSGFFDYSTDLFETDTIRRLARHFQSLLEAVVADPQRRISELPLMDQAERRTVLVEWNRTTDEREPAECLHRMFETQAERTPDALAVIRGDRKMSYGELDAVADVLAHRLRALGVGPERVVGLCAERSIEMVVGLLAILKAGGAYLPLEPEYPEERLSFMLEDSGASVLLVQPKLLPRFADYAGTVVSLEEQIEVSEHGRLPHSITPENLAYVIYTSGSTGRPKGVQVTHASACNHLRWRQSTYPLSESDSFLQKASISFDISVWEIFAPLLAGARLILAEPGGHRDSAYLARLIADERITFAHFHPAMLRSVLQEPDAVRWTSLRQVFCGGETLPLNTQSLFFDTSRARLCHQYGPTETTIDVAAWDCSPDDARDLIPIGRPISNTQLYVLDEAMRPVPVGLPGELYVGGLALARAYLNRPALTAERFVPDPFAAEPGARLYKTGDRSRWLADGAVQFLGRADSQVKIRGYRIEPGEVEAALSVLDGVKQAAVVARSDGAGEMRLYAYVIAEDGTMPDMRALRARLVRVLPEYMVPAAFAVLPEFPLTSGKIDRRRLPEIETWAMSRTSDEAPLRGPIEEAVASIWAEVLGISGVGARSNFFELGGHSLLATRVMARVREAFGVDVPLRALFEEPTVEGVSRAVEEKLREVASGEGKGEGLGRIEPVKREGGVVELSYGQRRLWFLQRLAPESAAYNLPMSVRLKGELDIEALRWSLGEIVRRHETLRTRIATVEGLPVATVEEDTELSITLEDLSGLETIEQRETAARQISLTEAAISFDFERGPLLRCRLLKLGEGDHVLSLVMPHVVSDGWSAGVMIREFAALYEARLEGRAAALPELRVQYADWAAWQRKALEGGALDVQLDYWRAQLGGTLPVLELPGDHPRPATPTGRGGHLRRALPVELSEGLKTLSATEGVTSFMVLLAVFKVLLHRYTGQEDIVVGTPIANRTRREIEDLVGFFVNMLILRTRVEGRATLREVLARVKETALGAYANQDVPFEKLVEVLQPARDSTRAPLFQVAFVMQQHAHAPALGVAGLEIEGAEVQPETARWDLTLIVEQIQDGLTVGAEYSTDLFEAETIERLLRHYERLLESLVADVGTRMSVAPMLTQAERRLLLNEWNQTAPPATAPVWRSVPELFTERARLHPSTVAVEHGGETLSYAELDQRADGLALHLRTLGVSAETLVGLCLGRGAEQVVAALAVLKAGGAYVPLDPTYPRERLAYMVQDSGLKVLVTRRGFDEGLTTEAVSVVYLDEPVPAVAGERDAACVTPENLAYVIYTSGSTGRPKGVALTHGGLSNLVAAQLRAFGVRPNERVLQFAAFSFDASVSEFFVTLLAGATLVLADAESLLPGKALAEFLERRSVTMATLPPSALSNMPRAKAGTLMKLVTAGEPLTPGALAAWVGDGREIINAYGPTETTVCATTGVCDHDDETITIGRPIDSTEVYILGEDFQLVPTGVTGELYVGGRGLARGYVNLPALTAEKFGPDPFSGRSGARLYRTGDLARWTSDGRVEFIGRRDHQVKLRGFRVELGEVESVLGRHPSVVETAVVARADGPHGTRLVAYVVPNTTGGVEPHALLGFLREYLPDYMAPRAYVFLDAFPRTPAGKVDRKALPTPDDARVAAGAEYVEPAGELERRIAGIWRDALGLERVGVDDNFFDLGGHSLLVAQVHGRLETALGRTFPLMLLFTHPTVRSLAGWLAGNESAEQFSMETIKDRAGLRRASTARRGDSRRATRRAGQERSS